jgi:hypothetical protein
VSNFKYTITKFDAENKLIVVTFDDGAWAELRLTNPLPKDIISLEDHIKRFTAPKEAIEAQLNPDADLSYINTLVGVEKECERFSLNPNQEAGSPEAVDHETEANLAMWEQVQFQNKVGEALVALGVVATNPATIPVAN